MFNSKKLKIIACSLFIFLIIILPIGNIYAEDINPLTALLLISPATWPLQTVLSISNLIGFNPTPDLLVEPISSISGGIIKGVASLMLLIGGTIMGLGQGILLSVIESSSTWLNPTENSIVTEGWGIVRNVANAVLVIGLVIIAINIILGREENKAKKTLINFIIVALLINFTPVLCGFIIDGANILTKSFVSGGIDGNMSNMIVKNFSEGITASGSDALNVFMVSFVFLIFAFISTFIYLLYALLFLGRSVILWLLVIFSPIAFATKVFPQSKYVKKIFPSVLYWDDWLESFFQWCVIGIPAGMSIYLANMLIPAINFTINASSSEALMSSMVNSAIQCLTPFVILVAGFFISISAGGQVGSYVGGVATGAWAMSGGKAMGKVRETAVAGGEWMVEGGKRTVAGATVGGLSGISQGYSDAGIKGAMLGGATGAAMGGLGAEGREKAAKRISEIKENVGFTKRGEYDAKINAEVEEAQKRLENLSDDKLKKITTSGVETRSGNIEKAAAFNALNKKGKLGDNEIDYLANNKNWAETFNVKLKDIAKAKPEHAQKLINKSTYDVISGMSPAEAGKTINSSSFADPQVLSSLNKQTMKGKLDKGTAEDLKNIREGFSKLLQNMNTFSSTTVLPEDLNKLVLNNLTAIEKETDKMISSGVAEEKRKAEIIRGLVNAQKQRRI